jgi:hypothetical protein
MGKKLLCLSYFKTKAQFCSAMVGVTNFLRNVLLEVKEVFDLEDRWPVGYFHIASSF